MSYLARATPMALATCAEKLRRAPLVLEALAKKNHWAFEDTGGRVRISLKKQGGMYANIHFNKLSGEFTYDTDFRSSLEPALRKIMKADGSLSDVYEVADVCVANEIENGWKWRWTGEETAAIDEQEIFA